jgi:hypothetical protein
MTGCFRISETVLLSSGPDIGAFVRNASQPLRTPFLARGILNYAGAGHAGHAISRSVFIMSGAH